MKTKCAVIPGMANDHPRTLPPTWVAITAEGIWCQLPIAAGLALAASHPVWASGLGHAIGREAVFANDL
jgi:hypothetical protein